MRDELDDQGEWIDMITGEHRMLYGPGRRPREADLDRLTELAGQLVAAHDHMTGLYRRHLNDITAGLIETEHSHDRN
ncbi:hypothetical protein [Amycolatopsis sp. H20-H5]|uniref:hypothetical protein n=1 Tax=Amycolatopsis sp. H20-H5 TaxID=3046309 RepID=UPI002DB79ECC|nr:hypothetical protein [Amycolatopsis sp. H20-H5]MEC3974854.1 hypothetical protein [Amycolatopsis sp. H20-H5]